MVAPITSDYLSGLYNRLPYNVKGHSMRVSIFMQIIAAGYIELVEDGQVCSGLESSDEALIQFALDAGSYHDIGKIAVPKELLSGKYQLQPQDSEKVKKHTIYAEQLFDEYISQLNASEKRYFNEMKKVCVFHHERWDGKGYPFGLVGKNIPLFAQICAIANDYDHMTCQRQGRREEKHRQAVEAIAQGAGSQYDPQLVKAFMNRADQIKQLREKKNSENALLYC